MFEITKILHNSRIVTICGPPGIGKTSISRNLANYYKERRYFKDGIVYVKLRGCTTAQMFLTHLSLSIRSALGEIDENNLLNSSNLAQPPMKKHYSAIEDKQEETLDIIKNKIVLFVLDN